MNHYDVLGVPTNATASEIGGRYRALKALYEHEIGTYGLLSEGDREESRAAVEQAYFVLCDTLRRKGYDRELAAQGHAGPWLEIAPAMDAVETEMPSGAFSTDEIERTIVPEADGAPAEIALDLQAPVKTDEPRQAGKGAPSPAPEAATRPAQQPVLKLAPPGDCMDGDYLRMVRDLRGVSLEELSRTLKITQTQLENIEAQRFDRLPAPVYLRGFLKSYARAVGIDGERLASDYMQLRDAWERSA